MLGWFQAFLSALHFVNSSQAMAVWLNATIDWDFNMIQHDGLFVLF